MCNCCKIGKGSKNELVSQMAAVLIGNVQVGTSVLTMSMTRGDYGYTLDTEYGMEDGEPAAGTSIDIEYCPFCGEKLQ